MPLNRVTITGADDNTKPADLLKLWEKYPFVEWGILIGTHSGMQRFPSIRWIMNLVDIAVRPEVPMPLSLHVCGIYLRQIIQQGASSLHQLLSIRGLLAFGRVQLNWHGVPQTPDAGVKVGQALAGMAGECGWSPTVIFQLDGSNDDVHKSISPPLDAAGLFDASHGAGVTPFQWPARRPDLPCGWSGGLGPDNLERELPRIEAAAEGADYWVDMETRVRTSTSLDPFKVNRCLEIAKSFMDSKA